MNPPRPPQPAFEVDSHVDQHALLIPKRGRPELSSTAFAPAGITPTGVCTNLLSFDGGCNTPGGVVAPSL